MTASADGEHDELAAAVDALLAAGTPDRAAVQTWVDATGPARERRTDNRGALRRYRAAGERLHAGVIAGGLHVTDDARWDDAAAWPWRHTHDIASVCRYGTAAAAHRAVRDLTGAHAYAFAQKLGLLTGDREHCIDIAYRYPDLDTGQLWALLDDTNDTNSFAGPRWGPDRMAVVAGHPNAAALIAAMTVWKPGAASDVAEWVAVNGFDRHPQWLELGALAWLVAGENAWAAAVDWASAGNPDVARVVSELAPGWGQSLRALADTARLIAANPAPARR